mmetsp:Transcript_19057/g.29343  ORF Transcript_19057/g.29343 Transcript_19057/m.29343 type:complete len:263 (-) Transcript_19057:343-1131(-)
MPGDQTFKIPMSNWYPRFLAWIFCLIGFVLSAVAVQSCQFFKSETLFNGNNVPTIAYWGLYKYAARGTYCVSLSLLEDSQTPTDPDKFEVDASWKVAQAAGVAAPIIGGIATLMLTLQICRPIRKLKWIAISVLSFVALVIQGVTFLVLNSDECKQSSEDKIANTAQKCTLEEGANQAIAAMTFYFVAGITMCCTSPPETPLLQFTTDPTKVVNGDGSTIVDGTTVQTPPTMDEGEYAPGTSAPHRHNHKKHHTSGGKYGEA